jgi:hypothetical protein
MSDDPLLRQAWAFYKQGRFAAALEGLEPQIFRYRENPDFFRMLGLCCLRQGDWKGGETYLERSRQLDEPAHRDVLLGLMAVAARKKDHGEAARIALELLDRNPRDSIAKKSLARLRAAVADAEERGIDRESLGRWLPGYSRGGQAVRRWLIRIVAGTAVAAGIAAGIWWGISLVRTPPPAITRQGSDSFAQPLAGGDEVLVGSGFAVTMTPEEVKQTWQRVQKAFQDYQDSKARYEINRILLSNAIPLVKERARALIPYLHDPDFARAEDSSSYLEVRIAPALYEGCTVRWQGVIANLNMGPKKITFDFLLGYQDGQVVEGIVPVELGFAALLKNSQVVEVLGRVLLRDGKWLVQGTSLRELGYRTP